VKYVQGSYNIYLDRMVTDSEIGENGLRFATVGDGSSAEFKVFASDKGFFDKEYTVGSEDYVKGDSANSDYNGDSLDDRKPGKEAVDNYFDGTYTKAIATLADNTGDLLQNDTNFKLIGSSSEISDGGETILNMSRANYSNAVYMDRLNKRLGEARYIDGDEGIWMRLRHDRIGKQDDFRSMNTMYEIGYDRKADVDNGQRRIGIAGDYMQGSTEYTGVSGSGDIKRIGLWAYDTWLGDKGHYADYVVKWGHLSNDFNLFRNEKISGDYSNDVFSVSAEYGKKNDIGGDWYFEPQAQLQYAYVTDAHYSSSQGTEVDVDSIHSLIARGGFRIGKDFGSEKKSTVYFKADIMHEFLGDQDIAVRDSSTDGSWTAVGYGNEGTWFDVGFGFAAQTGDNSYVYLDLEQSFGNDNEDTYQINAGMQWSF
jgi:outer membrane autotransporter protein